MRWISTFSLIFCCLLAIANTPARAADPPTAPPKQEWSFSGIFGTYDRDALRRGYKVYKEVCAACHGMHYLAFRNLSQAGGPEFSNLQVKALASEYSIIDGPDSFGEMYERSGLPSDIFPEPYPNENAARAANSGANPPDLSLIVKARSGGADYIYALLVGYKDAPAGMAMQSGFYYNPYMDGETIAMPAPLFDDIVTYDDGTPATIAQTARDVTHFLAWASEPEMEARKRIGFMVLIYLTIFAGLLYFTMRKIWSNAH